MRLLLIATLFNVATAFTPPAVFTAKTTTAPFSSSMLFQAVAHNAAGEEVEKKKVIVLGGDGFCGWPTSLYLSDQGHDVVIVDNLSRRNIDNELGCDSLTPIQSPEVSISYILLQYFQYYY